MSPETGQIPNMVPVSEMFIPFLMTIEVNFRVTV